MEPCPPEVQGGVKEQLAKRPHRDVAHRGFLGQLGS